MRGRVLASVLRAHPTPILPTRRFSPALVRWASSAHSEETFESFNQRYQTFFQSVEDVFELQRGLNNCFAHDLVPSPSVIEAAVRAA